MADQLPLGRQMLATLNDITALMGATHDPNQLNVLIEQRAQLLAKIADLVDKVLDQESEQYKAATLGLQAASASVRLAIQDLSQVQDAIKIVATALSLAAKAAVA